MRCLFSWIVLVAWGLIGSTLIGCGGESPQGVTASGQVTADDRPLSGAVITLEPIDGTTGPNASAPILDGRFEIPASAGLTGGTYRVRISMIPAELRAALPDAERSKMPPRDAVVHPRYDGESRVRCQLTPGGENTLSFEVDFL